MPGSSTSRNPAPLAQSYTMLNPTMPPPVLEMASNASNTLLPRTASAPAPAPSRNTGRTRPRLSHALEVLDVDIDIEDPYATTNRFEIPADFKGKVIPGSQYDVVLVLDNREKSARENPDGIARALRAKGVDVERRALELGDVCWIAKRKPHFCDGTEYDTITLDVILERKRLDDLVGSIKDGRFHEQKFRLANSAIKQVFYVVEEYKNGVYEDKNRFDLAIDTALSQTQVIDGFMVKETKSIEDTINYYWTLHRHIQHRYEGKELHVIPSQHIRRYNFLKFQKKLRHREPNKSYLTAFTQFQFLNSKSGFITVQETWARMLLCVIGVSPEKAGEIVKRYPTMRSMYLAFLEGEEQERMERHLKKGFKVKHMLEDIGGNTGRRIGPALSEKIYNVIMGSVQDDCESD
ncbi:hypothetical protein D9758_009394 [Tetrapyrgos nigripes]|uniref:Crossover junction endonuclease MUS81 n=1 Tax=Tetrapyrgos nigripes TaxID=182062 RepID=A0A8H5D1P1_9AGAR|nr:hypothetical protein D9758_009394 [Tetrapyrgos nigripes]